MKKKILTTLSVVLILGLAALGILAYLQDEDSDVNVMTLGNVSIEQIEHQRVDTAKAGTLTEADIEDFEQGKPLLPYVDENLNGAMRDDYEEVTFPNGKTNKLFICDNAIDKMVAVTNTGKSDAYVRTIIALEAPTDKIDLSFNSTDWQMDKTASSHSIEVNGVKYDLFVCVYKNVLEPGETTPYSLLQLLLDRTATNEDAAQYGDVYEVLALSQAVQVEGFDTAATALDTAFGEVNKETAEAWFTGMGNVEFVGTETAKDQVMGEEAEEILADLKNGKNLVIDEDIDILGFDTNNVDAKGATVDLNGQGPDAYGYLAFIPNAGEDVTVSNLNVKGSGFVEVGHYGMGGGNYTLDNVKIENLAATLANGDKGFTLGCAFAHYGNAVLNDCVMIGTTAVQAGTMPVDAGFVNGTTTVVNDGKYGTIYCWSHANVTIDDADVDTLYVAPIKGTVTIKAGTNVGTININYGTSSAFATAANLAKLVIEDGASVGKIVYNGNTYTVAEWNAYVASL